LVAGAAAQVPCESLAHLCFRWLWILGKKSGRRGQYPWRALTTLKGVVVAKGLLKRTELAIGRFQAFDRGDLVPRRLDNEEETGPHRLSVHQHVAATADALLAAGMSASQNEILTQTVQQAPAGLDQYLTWLPVD